MQEFIQSCKDKLGVTVELKTVFTNSIFYPKKNRYVAWTGNEKDEPIIKGLDGLSNSNPLWVRKWFKKIAVELVKHPETRFQVIPKLIQESFDELDSRINAGEELKFTQRLKLYPYEYEDHVRTGILAKLLDKDKGDLVYWYETYTLEYVKSKECWKRKKNYSIKPENLNLDEYKNLLLNKLKDSLEIAGFDTDELKLQISHATTISVGTQVNHMKLSIKAGFVPHAIKRENDNETMLVVENFVNLQGAHPFVKWAGGKGQLLSELDKLIPSQFNRYFEPFLGGAAMFFHLASDKNMNLTAYLSDINEELIKAFKVVRDNVRELIEVLNQHQREYDKNPSKYYYRLRELIQPTNDIEIAARFVALNKTCFNGLYRVNQNGKFNVPMGDYKKPLICDSSNLKNASSLLRHSNAEIQCIDYREMLSKTETNDFVYLDPPYDPVSYTSDFTAYTPNGFGREDQVQLANVFGNLSDRGCSVLLNNSDTPFIRTLYSDFSTKDVNVQRAINCKGSKRTGHKELLISNYNVDPV